LTKNEFNQLLENAKLSKKEFSEIIGLAPITVNGWGGKTKGVPIWVKSWLELYIENKKCKELKEIIKANITDI